MSLNRKINSNKTKDLLVENELKKLKTFDSSYFTGKSHFEEGGTQNYFLFQTIFRFFKSIDNTDYVLEWKPKGLSDSDESIKSPTTNNNILDPSLNYLRAKIRVKFNGSCLKQDKIANAHKAIVNIYIVYEINANHNISSYLTLKNCLFGAVKLIKNIDINEHKYSGYGIGFDGKGTNSVGNGCGRVFITFGVEMSSTMHVDNKKKDIAILREGPSKGLDGTKLTAEKKHSINFAENNKKFCLPLHYNGANSYLFVDDTEIIKFTAKDFEIVATTLFLGNY